MSNATQVTMTDQFVDDLLTAKPESLADTSTAVWLIRELAREVQRLRGIAPWHENQDVLITGGHYEGFPGKLIYQTNSMAYVVLLADSQVMAEAIHATPIPIGWVKVID